MCHVVLPNILLIAIGACWGDPGTIRIGMTLGEVEETMGEYNTGGWAAGNHLGMLYNRPDGLGGDQEWGVQFGTMFGPGLRVEKYKFDYVPFTRCPPWARRLHEAISPPNKEAGKEEKKKKSAMLQLDNPESTDGERRRPRTASLKSLGVP